MKLIDFNREPANPDQESPKEGFAKYAYLIGNNFCKLVKANLIFVLFCIHIITIPAATGGLARVSAKLVRSGNCFVWDDFWEEFKKEFFSYLLIGLFCALVCTAGSLMLYLYSRTQSIMGVALFIIGILIIALSVICYMYSVTIKSNIVLPVSAVIRDALILTIAYSGKNILICAGLCVIFFLVYMFFPYSLLFLVTVLFSFMSLTVTMLFEDSIYKHIIIPYRNQQH